MDLPFTSAPHHDVLALLVQLAVLLLAARVLAEVAQRLGQPAVVGEILAGILLGPSLLSGFFPAIGEWVVPQSVVGGNLLELISMIGALFLLLITGLETDLGLIRQHARTAIGVSFGGILVTFATGFTLGWMLPVDLLVGSGPDQRLVFSLFVATAMSISAIPVIAKVLMDLDLMRRDIGQTIIAAGMSDDTIGWILLSVVAGLAASGTVDAGSVLVTVGRVALFMVGSFTVGRWLVKRSVDYVQDRFRAPDRLVTLAVVLMLTWGAVTQALGLEAVLGAFVMGILLGQLPRLHQSVHHRIATVGLAIFTPIFFATAGLKVNARALLEPRLLLITLVVILVASGGKVVGTYLGARLIGRRDHWTSLSYGAGLNARGAMEIIIATIGLELGILTPEMFSIIVVMAMATSLMAPPAMRWVLARVEPEQQELDRLRREELSRDSRIARIHRVLLPVRRRPTGDIVHTLEGAILNRLAGQSPIAVTLFNVSEAGGKPGSLAFLEELTPLYGELDVTRRVVEGDAPDSLILEEAQKGYDLLVLGATEQKPDGLDAIFHPVVDRLVRFSPCPTVVVKGGAAVPDWRPRKILVPTNGSHAAREAAELAFRIARPGELVAVLNVVRSHPDAHYALTESSEERQYASAHQIVSELRDMGEAQGIRTLPLVRVGEEPDEVILQIAREAAAGLIVLGTDVRPGSDRLFLGPRVERILDQAPCPVLVYNTPAMAGDTARRAGPES
ncbi:MAG TPA: cation:proton antiporter [Longimicrobiales bacterium]|nr:cation:proton antiporter [Longimicrobiales bacterium]